MGRCPNPTGVRARPRRTRRVQDAETRQLPAVAGSMRSAPPGRPGCAPAHSKSQAGCQRNEFIFLAARPAFFCPGALYVSHASDGSRFVTALKYRRRHGVQGQRPSFTPRIICWDRYQKAARTALRSCRRCHTPSASPLRRRRQNSCRPPQ